MVAGPEVEEAASAVVVDPYAGGTSAVLKFAVGEGAESEGVSYDVLSQLLEVSLEALGHEDVAFAISNPEYKSGSIRNFAEWDVKIALPPAEAQKGGRRPAAKDQHRASLPALE